MKIIYFTRPCYLDLGYSYARELAKQVELHLVIEISPESRQSSIFDISDKTMQEGVVDGVLFFKQNFPKLFIAYLEKCASITLIVHNCSKSIHPLTWKTNYKAMDFCNKVNPDVIHFDGISLRTVAGIWKLRNFPIVCSIHDPIRHSGEKNWRAELARKISFPFIDRFLLHSTAMEEAFLTCYPKFSPTKVVHNYLAPYDIFCQWIKSPIQDNGKTVLFFGRLSPYKGVDVLIQAAPLIAQHIMDVCIVIAGQPIPGYTLPNLPSLANGGKFKLLDTYIDNDLLAELFQQATIVACPYIDATQSGVVLTAYAFGKPVIVTNTGGLPEYLWQQKETGCLVPSGDHQQLAKAICSILDHPHTQKRIKSNIEEMKKVANNWHITTDKSIIIYSKLLEELNEKKRERHEENQ